MTAMKTVGLLDVHEIVGDDHGEKCAACAPLLWFSVDVLPVNLVSLVEVFGKETHMSYVNGLYRMTVILRIGICILVSVLINSISPFVLRAYEYKCRGLTIIPLTEFVLCQLPYVLLLLSLGMFAGPVFLRGCNLMLRRLLMEVLLLFFVIGCFAYLIGSLLPFIDTMSM